MEKKVYDDLIEALALRGGAIMPKKNREFYKLIKELFTEEEAELASKMPLNYVTAETLAQETGKDTDEIISRLEEMANKGLIFSKKKNDDIFYALPQMAPGIFEFQFMRGTYTEHDKKLARYFDEYHKVARGTPEGEKDHPSFPFSRVIPVEKTIQQGTMVHTYDKVTEYIEKSKRVSVSPCFCRHQAELLDRPCDKPKETCFSFGPTAVFAAERGMGRPVTKDEAIQILDHCEKAGLVHCSSNVKNKIDFLCNCCLCHCEIIKTFKDQKRVNLGAVSNYIVKVSDNSCTACESCIEICPMDAISLNNDDKIDINIKMCIGCGLCVSSCQEAAIEMSERKDMKQPPENFIELVTTMAGSMQKK